MMKNPQINSCLNNMYTGICVRPRGVGFIPPEYSSLEDELTDYEIIDKINSERSNVAQLFIYTEKRSTVQKKPFICKARFIIDREDQTLSRAQLISLLADRRTLFSLKYQGYLTDHPFYRNERKQSGKSRDEQRKMCINQALLHCSERKAVYRPVLEKLEQWAILHNKSVSTYEEILVKSAAERELSCAVEKLIGPKKQTMAYRAREAGLVHLLCQFYSGFPLNGKIILSKLQEWIPDIQLTVDEASTFVSDALYFYCYCEQSQIATNKLSGHYVPEYQKIDAIEFENYICVKQYLTYLFDQCQKAATQNGRKNFALPFGRKSFSSSKDNITSDKLNYFEDLCEATQQYLEGVGSKAKCFDKDCATNCVLQLQEELRKASCECLFPFVYLLICIVGGGRFFSGPYSVGTDQLEAAYQSIYREKPVRWKQRLIRIEFMQKLCDIQNLTRDQRFENWSLFLDCHGPRIASEDEKDLWQAILGAFDFKTKQFKNVSLPAVELQIFPQKALSKCLHSEPETLYCYQSCSLLHFGGYAKFLKEYPETPRRHSLYISKNIKQWERLLMQYLSEWSAPQIHYQIDPSDPAEQTTLTIQTICSEAVDLFEDNEVVIISKTRLKTFYNELSAENFSINQDYEKYTHELKSLITEHAMRLALIRKAKMILGKELDRHLMQFGIGFSDK